MKVLALVVVLACLFFAVAQKTGAHHEHTSEPTADMNRAISAVLSKLDKTHDHDHTLVKIVRIAKQVVAGQMYHFDLVVKFDDGNHNIFASVYHKLDDSMRVTKIVEGIQMKDLSEDQKKAVFTAMQHLGQKNGEDLELLIIRKLSTQVVNGVIYKFDVRVRGTNTPIRNEVISVHHHWSGAMKVVA
jgi:hypothetical protein